MLANRPLVQKAFCRMTLILTFIAVIALAYFYRDYDFERESIKYSEFIPFTLESALMYSYSWDIAKNGHLEQGDKLMSNPGKLNINQEMSVSMEYFLGYAYRLKHMIFDKNSEYDVNRIWGVNFDFMNRIRCQIRLWISMTAGIIFLILLTMRCSFLLSALGGVLFAVIPAAIARATGQDLVMENFAIPLIMFTFLVYYSYRINPRPYKPILLLFSVFLALSSWDMTQLVLALWLLSEIIFMFFRSRSSGKLRTAWIALAIGVIMAGILNPYLATHKFLCSPAASVLLPSLLIMSFFRKNARVRRFAGAVSLFVLLVLWIFLFRKFGYSENYSHFASLIFDKIKFLNVKPVDPSLLSFDSRILWTPALHSATWNIIWTTFHLVLPLFILLALLGFSVLKVCRALIKMLPRSGISYFLTAVFLIMFILMVRFEALLAPFLCISLPLLVHDYRKSVPRIVYISIVTVLTVVVIVESSWFFNLTRSYYDDDSDKIALIKEMNDTDNLRYKTVLADFTISPMLRAYCNVKVVLTPKFELKNDRERVYDYLNILYHGNERKFYLFCMKYKVNYFIFDKGMAYGGTRMENMHPWSVRYIANAPVLDENSPVYLFNFKPDGLRHFYKLDNKPGQKSPQDRFEIYKVVTDEDIRKAAIMYYDACQAIYEKKIIYAKAMIKSILLLDPASEKARYLFYQLNGERWPLITKDGVY